MKRGPAILFVIIILLFFVLIYVKNKSEADQFVWNPDYRTHNKEPFGGYVLDKMLEASWEDGFSHEYKNFYRMRTEEILTEEDVLIVANYVELSETETNSLLEYVAEGHHVLIAATSFGLYEGTSLADSLHFRMNQPSWFNFFQIGLNTDTLKQDCSLRLSSSTLNEREYKFPEVLCKHYFDSIPDWAEVLALKNGKHPVAIQYKIGEGKLVLCSHPVLFSNYGMLSDQHEYVWGLLSYLKGAPLIRTEYYEVGYSELGGFNLAREFDYIASQPPLRWALYITLISILLFLVFTAKRKQRPIPIVKRPDNQLLHFVRSMSALYLRKSNNNDILKKKYLFFAEQLSKEYHIDVINQTHDLPLFERIAQKTGSRLEDVRALFKGTDLLDSDFSISDKDLMDLVILMDKIVKNINK